MASGDADRHLKSAGIFPKREYLKVTTTFNKFPSSLKKSNPTAWQARQPGKLAACNKRRMESKVAFISGTPFPCQKGAIFPDARASEKRLKTSLYHYKSRKLAVAFFRQDDDEEGDDDDQPDDNSLQD
jgi:hypothetical protein